MVLSTFVKSWSQSPRIVQDLVLKDFVCSWLITHFTSHKKDKLIFEACETEVVSCGKERSGFDQEVILGIHLFTLQRVCL